jgi:hypothetical protein
MRKTLISTIIAIVGVVAFFLVITTTTTSATYEPKIEKLEPEELQNWFHRKDTIFTIEKSDTIAVAIFEHYEYELNPHHRRPNILVELCFIQIDNDPQKTTDLIRFIHTMHSTSKIQVEFKDQYDRVKLWGKKMY